MVKRHYQFNINEFYHIYNRGVNREKIFFEEDNYQYFLKGIKRYLLPIFAISAYCLMPTHYHLLVRIRDSSSESDPGFRVGRAMQKLSISYTKAINRRYDRVGALFQGAYNIKVIDTSKHLNTIIPYIHQNPINAGLVSNEIDWKYSSASVYSGKEESELIEVLY